MNVGVKATEEKNISFINLYRSKSKSSQTD